MVTLTKPKSSYVVIDTERCKGCHLCIAFCPKKVLKPASRINRMGYTPAEVNEEKARDCTGCGVCAICARISPLPYIAPAGHKQVTPYPPALEAFSVGKNAYGRQYRHR